MAARTINGLALCAGGYGLEAGLHIALPGIYCTVCAVERQAYPVACLVAAMENKALAPFPIWDDIATFDPAPWRECVDIVTAGYPCQPFSLAGTRQGEDDSRHLWPHIRRIVRGIMPTWVFCENVAAHLTLGFDAVKDDLECLGYRVEAGIFAAADVGAPHIRERLFFLGQLADDDSQRQPQPQGSFPEFRRWIGDGSCTDMGDTKSQHQRAGLCPEQAQTFGIGRSYDAGCAELGDTNRSHDQRQGLQRRPTPGFIPWPWPAGRGAGQYPWEAPRIVEPSLGRTTSRLGARDERLYMLGNGVVPVCAALAFVSLWQKLNG